jgi:ribosomal protein S20
MGDWKAVRPKQEADWELYDLKTDISETTDLANTHPEVLSKIKQFAKQSHAPIQSGSFASRENHLKDRSAKAGGQSSKPGNRQRKARRKKSRTFDDKGPSVAKESRGLPSSPLYPIIWSTSEIPSLCTRIGPTGTVSLFLFS